MKNTNTLRGLAELPCLVTGAANGFGRGIVTRLLEEEAKVAALDCDRTQLEAFHAGLPGEQAARLLPLVADVSRSEQITAALETVRRTWGELRALVNNAGVAHQNQSLLDLEESEMQRLWSVNVLGVINATRLAVPLLRANEGGSVIIVGSTAGIRPRPGLCYYNATKAAANCLGKSMALEFADWGIRVNTVCPCAGETDMLKLLAGEDFDQKISEFTRTSPLKRLARPEDVAAATAWLLSDDARFITGIELPVDGGRCV